MFDTKKIRIVNHVLFSKIYIDETIAWYNDDLGFHEVSTRITSKF